MAKITVVCGWGVALVEGSIPLIRVGWKDEVTTHEAGTEERVDAMPVPPDRPYRIVAPMGDVMITPDGGGAVTVASPSGTHSAQRIVLSGDALEDGLAIGKTVLAMFYRIAELDDPLMDLGSACPIRLLRRPNGEVELWGTVDGVPHWEDTVRMSDADYASAVARLAECFPPGVDCRGVLERLPVAEDYWHEQYYASLRPITPTLWVVREEYRGPWTEEIRPIYAPDGDPLPAWNALVAEWRREAHLEALEERFTFFEELDDGSDDD